MKQFSILLTAAVMMMFAGAAQGAIVNIDIDGTSPGDPTPVTKSPLVTGTNSTGGAAAIGFQSDLWNGVLVNSGAPNILSQTSGFVNADGSASSLTLSISGFDGADTHYDDFPVDDLLNDYLVALDTATITIGGLVPNTGYDLYLFGSNGRDGAGGVFSVNGSATQTAAGGNPGGNPFAGYYSAVEDYATFLNVSTNASGELVVTETPEVANISIFNGFQLSDRGPPPPATAIGARHRSLSRL